MSGARVGAHGATALAAGLRVHPALRRVVLSRAWIGALGCEALVDAVLASPTARLRACLPQAGVKAALKRELSRRAGARVTWA